MNPKIMKNLRNAVVLSMAIAFFCFGKQAHSNWTVINLHPPGAVESAAYDVHSGQQVGWVDYYGIEKSAALWYGSAASWVDLSAGNPGVAFGVAGNQQVGQIGTMEACLWYGTFQSIVSLHPHGQGYGPHSFAMGTDGTNQVGAILATSPYTHYHAMMWSGSASSFYDLHPPGMAWSEARDVHSGKQVGFVIYPSGARHASLWHSSFLFWNDLHPSGATQSEAWGVHGSQQVGFAKVGGFDHASLWYGTASSWVDLHPAVASSSVAYDVYAGRQVGYAVVGGMAHASFWVGTAYSWVDLHQYLPSVFVSSQASGIWEDSFAIYVVGWGLNKMTKRNEALMWVRPKWKDWSGPPVSPLGWWIPLSFRDIIRSPE